MEFHVKYSMELPWNTTDLNVVFMCFCPRRITMEKVFHGNSTWAKTHENSMDPWLGYVVRPMGHGHA